MKKFISTIVLFTICLLSSGCKKAKNDNISVYRHFYEQDVTTFNYIMTNNHSDYTHIANFVDGLVENDKYGNIVPSIAISWKDEIIDNKQIWTFYLRNDVYWSDYNGNIYGKVTANDFVTTLKYILNFNIGSNNYSLPTSLIDNGLNYYNATLINNYNYDNVINKISILENSDPHNELAIYRNIKDAFDFCNINECSDDFNLVGVKAINDFELQFTLSKPASYFLSALTYCSFLPTSEDFIKEVGFNNFGTNKKFLLYNGGYILKDYFHSSRIEYYKNPNYWDKDNIFIDKVIFNRLLNYPSTSYTRLAYESNNISEFYVNKDDSVGWKKYVLGDNLSGSNTNPAGDNTYAISETSDYTTYYFIFNQNRINNDYSTLSKEEINRSNIALQNPNFRKALLYGINRDDYNQQDINSVISSIIPENFIATEGKDYSEYFIDCYASSNNISYQEAETIITNNLIFDINKSNYYLDLALEELNFSNEELPIKIEFSYFFSQDFVKYDQMRIAEWNRLLNGCDSNSDCRYDKIVITYNDTLNNYTDFSSAIRNGEYSISILGIYPNFIDPIAYLEAFAKEGEMSPYINTFYFSTIETLLTEINNYYKSEDLEKRFELCAKLEYEIIFNQALILPLYITNSSDMVIVSNLVPFEKMKANYGLSPFKFKLRKMASKKYSQEEITILREEYEKGRIS